MVFSHRVLSRAVLGGGFALALMAGSSQAAVHVFQNDLTGFNLAAGNPAIVVTFDDPALGDISNSEINGIIFSNDDDNLIVVNAAAVGLPATSGARILSPGGTDLDAELDTVNFTFGPSTAFGLDILFQAGYSGDFEVRYDFITSEGANDFGTVSIGGTNAGSYFLGFTSDDPGALLTRITISDNDGSSNLAYDTIRRATPSIPEPSTWAMMIAGFGLAGSVLRRRRVVA